jgi:hypothetical protein
MHRQRLDAVADDFEATMRPMRADMHAIGGTCAETADIKQPTV